MADLKQFLFQSSARTDHTRRFRNLRAVVCAVACLGIVLPCLEVATAQQEPSALQRRKAELEVRKLELEVARLTEDRGTLPSWLTGVLGLLAGVVGTATSVWVARRARLGTLDQSVHDKRLDAYPELVKATAPLAVYFPGGDPFAASIGRNECATMGRAMSDWYLGSGGLLLSVGARGAYFRLARALTRASLAEGLRVPTFPRDAGDISVEKLDTYRAELAREFDLDNVEDWSFGGPASEKDVPAYKFKDFVFLQRLSSALRTALSADLRSRRRPS